jgi:osmotically-inducible protein OsmY
MVTQGTVMLHGSVPDQNLRQQAEQIARTVSGARNVRNELTIMGQMQRTAMGTMGQPQQMTATDSRLADQIEQQIHQQLPSANIDVMVSQGTVMLHGSVQDQSQKQQAEQIAKSVSGVQTVQNNLTVGAAGTGFPPLGYIPGQQDTGSADDIRCTQMLKQSLTNQNLKDAANNIFVTCHNGQMALYGNVKTDDEKDQIDRAAKQVQGIKNVDNNLTVSKETAQQKSDVQLKEDVESQLWWSPFVDSSKIDVAAQDGVVTLSGTVKGWDAEKAAVKNAFDAGARRVRSKLQIEGQPSTAMGQTGAGRDYGTTQQ